MSWFKMERGWQQHPAFRNNDERAAWAWLIEYARYEPGVVSIKSCPVKLERGQLSYSYSYLAQAWGVSVQSARTIINHFKKWQLINTQGNKGQLVITICNYSKYQDGEEEGNTQPKPKPTQGQQEPNNNKKKVKRKKKKQVIPKAHEEMAIRSLIELEVHPLDGRHADTWKEKFPDIDRFAMRERVIGYCVAEGKEYKDYWQTMQNWARSDKEKAKNGKSKHTARIPTPSQDDYFAEFIGETYTSLES